MSFFNYIDGGYIKSWCRVTVGRSHDIRNKDIIYPSVVLYNYKVVNLEIYPSKMRISFSFIHCTSTISNMLTATIVAFHSVWIRERASFSTPELTLWTPLLREELWGRKWIASPNEFDARACSCYLLWRQVTISVWQLSVRGVKSCVAFHSV